MQSNRRRDTSIEVTVGAFMFMILLALALFTIVLSQHRFFGDTWTMEIRFADVMGVREGDGVFLRGVEIGKIRRIRIEEDGVAVTLRLDRRITLREDYRIEVLVSSVLGGRYINILEGSPDLPPHPPSMLVHGQPPSDLLEDASQAVASLRNAIEEEGGVLDRLTSAMGTIEDVLDRVRQGEGTIGRLLSEDDIYEDFAATVAALRTASTNLAEGRGTLARLLQDDGQIHDDIAGVTGDLRTVARRLQEGEGIVGRLLVGEHTLVDDLEGGIRSLRAILDAAEQGEGTLGRLARDPGLYDDMRLLLHEVRATVDDFRETTPITTFTSILFGVF